MGSEDEDSSNEGSRFVPRNKSRNGKPSRPRSISAASQIISNPKLIKSLQNLDECQSSTPLSRPLSLANIRINNRKSFTEGSKFHEEIDFEREFQESQDSSLASRCKKYMGILLAFFASFVFSFASIIVKSISDDYHPYTLSLWTFMGILVPSIVVLLFKGVFKKESIFSGIHPLSAQGHFKNFVLILIRALFGAGGTVLKVYSLQFMTAADSTVIAFSSPVFVVIVAWICLDEKCGVIPILTAIVVLLGVGFISRPPWLTGQKEFDTTLLLGCAMAFGCMLLGTFVVVILRYTRNVHYAFITLIYGLVGTFGSIGLCLWIGRLEAPMCLKHWIFAVGIAALTFIGQTALTVALQHELAGLVGLVRPSEIVFIFGFQLIFLSKTPDWLSLTGAFIVILGVTIITARKWISTLPQSNSTRKTCNCLLL